MRKALFVQHTNPAGYPPIQHAIAILLSAGWEVQSVGVGIAVTASLRMPTHPRFKARMMRVAPTNGVLQRMPDYTIDLAAATRPDTVGIVYGMFDLPASFSPSPQWFRS